MRKQTTRLTLALAGLVLAAILCRLPVLAASGASLFVRTDHLDAPKPEQIVVDLYYVGELSEDCYRVTEDFGGGTLQWSNNGELLAAAGRMAEHVMEGAQPIAAGRATDTVLDRDDAGEALRDGLYLVLLHGRDAGDYWLRDAGDGEIRTTAAADGVLYAFTPILAVLRASDGQTTVTPKVDEIPEPTPTPPPEPTPTPEPGPDEVVDIPDEEVPTGPLPQTGQLWWPVPPLAALGLAFIACGVAVRRKGSRG